MAERKRRRGNIKRAADIIHKRGGTPSEARAKKAGLVAEKKALAEGKGKDKAKEIGNKVAISHFAKNRNITNEEAISALFGGSERSQIKYPGLDYSVGFLDLFGTAQLAKWGVKSIHKLGKKVFGKTKPKTLESAVAQVRKKLNLGPNVPDKTITQKFINKLKLPGLTPLTAKTKALQNLKNPPLQNLKTVGQAMRNVKPSKLGPGIKLPKPRPRVVPKGKLRSKIIPPVVAAATLTAGKLGYDALKDKENILTNILKKGEVKNNKVDKAKNNKAGKTKSNVKTGTVNLLNNTKKRLNANIKAAKAGPKLKNKKQRVKKRKTAAEEHGAWSEEAGKEWFKKYLPGIEVEYTYPTDPEDWDEMDPSGKTDKTIEEEFGGRQWWEKESNKHGGKVVKRRGGGKALRGFGKATYSDKLY